jgi:Transglycosylase-like domain
MKERTLLPCRPERRRGRITRLGIGAPAALLLAALAVLVPLPANAQQDDVAAAKARAEQAANSYLDAMIRSLKLDAQIAEMEQGIARLEERVGELRQATRGRAIEAYKRSGTPVLPQVGEDALMDSARRSVLLNLLNSRDNDAADELGKARDDLRTHQHDLRTVQREHAGAVLRLKEDEQRLNSELVAAQGRRGAPVGDRGPLPLTDYVPRPGEHPQHMHPFLVCTRDIESNGNYQAYNGSGPYLGAYQFLQSTWNATASQAGRGELVGVDPRDASEYDQDDMAWSLYQAKGKGPWNGRC